MGKGKDVEGDDSELPLKMPVEIVKVVLVKSITVPSNNWGSVEVWTANSVGSGNISVILKTLIFLHDFLNIMDHMEGGGKDGSTYELDIQEHGGLNSNKSNTKLTISIQFPLSHEFIEERDPARLCLPPPLCGRGGFASKFRTQCSLNPQEHKGLNHKTNTLVPLNPGVRPPHSTRHGSDQVMHMTKPKNILPIYHVLFVGTWSVHLDTMEITQEQGQVPRQPRPATARVQTPPQPFNPALSPSPTQTPARGSQLSHNPDHTQLWPLLQHALRPIRGMTFHQNQKSLKLQLT